MGLFRITTPSEDDEDSEDDNGPEFDSISGFRAFLDEGVSFSGDLHVIHGVTSLSRETLIEELGPWLEIKHFGDTVSKLRSRVTLGNHEETGAYLAMNPSDEGTAREEPGGHFVLYSDLPKSSFIDDYLVKWVNETSLTTKLRINHQRIMRIISDASNPEDPPEKHVFSDEIVFRQMNNSDVEENIRNVNRTVCYYGNDALDRIDEFYEEYDLEVDKMKLKIPGKATFTIDSKGIFKLKSGSIETFNNSINSVIDSLLSVKSEYDNTDPEEVEFGQTNQHISQAKPARLRIEEEDSNWDKKAIEDLNESLKDHGYVLLNPHIEEEPLYFASEVYFTKKKLYFDMRGDKDEIRFFPRHDEEEISTIYAVVDIAESVLGGPIEAVTEEES